MSKLTKGAAAPTGATPASAMPKAAPTKKVGAAPVEPDPYPPISDLAAIGDCRSVALVSKQGTVEWLCLPRFDSPAVLASILDRKRGGRVTIRPAGEVGAFKTTRRYVPGTNVLETTFESGDACVRLTDFMPVDRRHLKGEHAGRPSVVRIVECVKGTAKLDVLCDPRPGFSFHEPERRQIPGGWQFAAQPCPVTILTDMELKPCPGSTAVGACVTLMAGETRVLAIGMAGGRECLPRERMLETAREKLSVTVAHWRAWLGQIRYTGRYQDVVRRSVLTLKMMAYAPTGAVVAAPTTSLPEHIGGERNWDYRYCWPRDAAMTLRALLEFGFADEACAFIRWLVSRAHMTDGGEERVGGERLAVIYTVDGHSELPEKTLEHLEGYRGSRPVRIGNGAHDQLQLDVYGTLVDAAYLFFDHGAKLTEPTARFLMALGDQVCRLWPSPDRGIWESRLPGQHFTLSKALCWVALDRLRKMHALTKHEFPDARFARAQGDIRRAIEEHGVDPATGAYRALFDQEGTDASLLLMAHMGYEPSGSARMRATLGQIDEVLGPLPLLQRHEHRKVSGFGPEGAFGICGFWAVETLARGGDVQRATEHFEELLTYQNDVGLYAEEIERGRGMALGNFPQALTHVGVLNAARTLALVTEDQEPGEHHDPRVEGEQM